jgi:drug/metabolite transporter (DMT)-like permease
LKDPDHAEPSAGQRTEGLIFGLLGVLAFSLTLPATRLAVRSIDPFLVGLGRGLAVTPIAAVLLYFTKQSWPTRPQWRQLIIVMLGVVFGFPLLMTWAMSRVEASHGAVVLGLLPLGTAVAGFIRGHERPSLAFWCASVLGSATVVTFALAAGGGHFQAADLALLGAVTFGAMGYAEGGKLGKDLGGWQVICWALLLGAPLLVPLVGWIVWEHGVTPTPISCAGFAYVSLVSAFLGFFAWYRGLAAGGVARISQLQLLQPFLTLMFAALFLGEHLGWGAIASAVLVALSILISRQSKIRTAS